MISPTILWVFLGTLIGALVTLIILAICMHLEDDKFDKEKFVKKLIKQKGWKESYEIITFELNGKYIKVWRRLYIEHIEKGDKEND